MQKQNIYVTDYDFERLNGLVSNLHFWNKRDWELLRKLEQELDSAQTMPSQTIPRDVITMNSKVHIIDLDSGEELIVKVVFPNEANYKEGRVSILSPIGMALLGSRAGNIVESRAPGRTRRIKIQDVLYQPEATGNYYL